MRSTLSLLAVVAMLSAGSAASAATFGAGAYGALNMYSMGDWNDAFDEGNSSGTNFDNIGGGFTGGVELRMWATPSWLITAGWEPLFASSEDGANPGNKFTFDANAFSATGAYFFPTSGNAKYGIGTGVDLIVNSSKAESPGSTTIDIKGSGIGLHLLGLGEWTVSPVFGVTGAVGYRTANTNTELSNDVETVDSPFDNDYSGVIARLGLAFYLPTASK